MDIFDAADFCRACLTTEYSLTEITLLDHDSVKFSAKLTVCVTDLVWLTEGLPSLICSNCIKHLRIAYDFRNVCLESDKKFRRYISQMQDKSKLETPQDESTSLLEDKIEITSTQVVTDTLPYVKEEPPNSPQINFLVDDDCESRDCISKSEKHDNFISQKQLEPVVDIAGRQHNVENPDSTEVTQMNQQDQQLQQELRIQQQPSQLKHVIERIAGVQRRPPSPENVTLDGVKSKSYTCNVCNKTFRHRGSFKIHTGEQITCYVCNAKFTYLRSLKAHMRKHTSKQSYPCTASNEQPQQQQDGVQSESYTCKVCSKSYQDKSSLANHMLIHKSEVSKPFECKYCKKRFCHSSQLERHVRSHTGEKPFACTICDQRCLSAFNLKVHMRTHTGERPYSCDTCGKKFIQRHHLTLHMKEHTSSRPYRCTVCNKVYKYSSSFEKHIMKHNTQILASHEREQIRMVEN